MPATNPASLCRISWRSWAEGAEPLGCLPRFRRLRIPELGDDDLVQLDVEARVDHGAVDLDGMITTLKRGEQLGWSSSISMRRPSGSDGSSRAASIPRTDPDIGGIVH